ncbi:MAG TPA: sulfur carrier protein ThiS [Pirellulales bacterium]|jgi:thiamine biosynthesis protein ThiS|nr:sulfur carrier protein ThiS [Pirellulales bacterium]
MQIVLNGAPREINSALSIAGLLAELKIEPKHVAVEVNLELVPRARHAERLLAPGDRLEIVTLVGGG